MNHHYPVYQLTNTNPFRRGVQRYGFNGKENDDEVVGQGNWENYGERFYSTRIGRFPSVDPLFRKFPYYSTYQFASNYPVSAVDIDGLEADKKFNESEIREGLKTSERDLKRIEENGRRLEHLIDDEKSYLSGLRKMQLVEFIPIAKAGYLLLQIFSEYSIQEEISNSESDLHQLENELANNRKAAIHAESQVLLYVESLVAMGLFGGAQSSESATSREAYRKAKDANGIPRSQQPDLTIKPNTPEGDKARLDSRNVRQEEFTNSKGEKITIRKDKAVDYEQGGPGNQGKHYNAGPSKDKLKQHHNYKK